MSILLLMIAIMSKHVPFEGMTLLAIGEHFRSKPQTRKKQLQRRPSSPEGANEISVSDKQPWDTVEDYLTNINNKLLEVCKQCCRRTPETRGDATQLYTQLEKISLSPPTPPPSVRL